MSTVLVTALLIVGSAFFVMVEFSLMAARRYRLEESARSSRAARRAVSSRCSSTSAFSTFSIPAISPACGVRIARPSSGWQQAGSREKWERGAASSVTAASPIIGRSRGRSAPAADSSTIPGPINTDLNPENGPFAETLKSLMALKRYGTGDEIAGLVSYLASTEAAYVTGASLLIDGGFAA